MSPSDLSLNPLLLSSFLSLSSHSLFHIKKQPKAECPVLFLMEIERAEQQQREKPLKQSLVAATTDRLDGADHLLAHRLEHRHDELLAVVKVLLDLDGELLGVVGSLGEGEVVLGVARVVHEGDEAVLGDVDEGVVLFFFKISKVFFPGFFEFRVFLRFVQFRFE